MEYPRLIVFDLDFTLWNCGDRWIDCTAWPFKSVDEKVFDSQGSEFNLYADVRDILQELSTQPECKLALASRTSQPSWAKWLLDEWELTAIFPYQEIYPGSKVQHFEHLREITAIPYEEMLFFDDEDRNIVEVGDLGVTAIVVPNGLSRERLETGLQTWNQNLNPG